MICLDLLMHFQIVCSLLVLIQLQEKNFINENYVKIKKGFFLTELLQPMP